MGVRVRLFAAARDAAGSSEAVVEPGPLAGILDELEARYGPPFGRVVEVATVLVDGSTAGPDDEVPDEAEVAILPPFSGG